MFASIQPRRSGKSLFLIEQASKENRAVIITFSSLAAKCLKSLGEEHGYDMDKIAVVGFDEVQKDSFKHEFRYYSVFIDELPIILNQMFNNVKGFSGTCPIVPKMNRLSQEELYDIKQLIGEEAFNEEYTLEWKEESDIERLESKIKKLEEEIKRLKTKSTRIRLF